MNATEVQALIQSQVTDGRHRDDWPHGVSLERCLTNPPVRLPFHTAWDPDQSLDLWLVLEERSEGTYCIAFDDEEQVFGIGTRIEDGMLLLGFYGTFPEALEAL